MRQLTSLDAQFLAAEDGAVYGHVTGLAVYDVDAGETGHLTRDDIAAIVASRIHLVPPFRRRLVSVPFGLDLPYWVEDPDFDLDRHIRAHELPAPGGDAELAEYVGKVMAEPLDLARPPWAIDVISGLADNRVAVATRIHHAASDGLAMAELFAIMHDPAESPTDRRPHPTQAGDSGESRTNRLPAQKPGGDSLKPERVPGSAEMFVRGLAGLPKQPLRFAASFPRAMPHLDQVVTMRALPGIPTASSLARRVSRTITRNDDGRLLPGPTVLAPRTKTSGRVSSRRAAAFTSTSLPEVKAIKNHFGVSVNDVVMTIVAGGLYRWLGDHGDLPADPLAAMVPVSVRTPDSTTSANAFGNSIAMMIPPVFSNEPDPARRLLLTHEAMAVAKDRHRAIPATLLQDTNHFIPPVLLARAARASAIVATTKRRSKTAANLLVSNIPGARDPQYLAGAPLVAHYPLSAIFHGIGLNVTIVSYQSQIDWGVALDPEQIDDAWGLIEAIKEAQAELLALVEAPVLVASAG